MNRGNPPPDEAGLLVFIAEHLGTCVMQNKNQSKIMRQQKRKHRTRSQFIARRGTRLHRIPRNSLAPISRACCRSPAGPPIGSPIRAAMIEGIVTYYLHVCRMGCNEEDWESR